ncbi:MAG: hypothetical protein ABEI53_00905 [Candidatus Magasanikbacteria bacterium]
MANNRRSKEQKDWLKKLSDQKIKLILKRLKQGRNLPSMFASALLELSKYTKKTQYNIIKEEAKRRNLDLEGKT